MDEKILTKIIENCIIENDRKYLTCEKAFQIARELNVDASNIGRLCNRENIKIRSCQIGCF